MRIIIVGSIQGDGGYEEKEICELLRVQYTKQGHSVEMMFLPYERNILSLPEQLMAYTLMDFSDCDALITVGFPACMLSHKNKICYLLQTEPTIAEYYSTKYGVLQTGQYNGIKSVFTKSMKQALSEAKKVVAASKLLASDLESDYGIEAEAICYTLIEKEGADCEEGNYYIAESSLLPWQRAELLTDIAEGMDSHAKIRLFVPNSNNIYRECMVQVFSEYKGKAKIEMVFRRPCSADYASAKEMIVTDYFGRRLSNVMVAAMKYDKPLLAPKDAGAALDYIPYSNVMEKGKVDFWNCEHYAMRDRSLSIVDFAERLLL